MDSEEWRQGRTVWAPPIGRLLLAFGEIEYCLTLCLCQLDCHRNWEKLKGAEFKKKTAESIRVLTDNHLKKDGAKRAIRLLNDAMQLAQYRNLVAHNPLTIGAFTNESGDIAFRLVVTSLRGTDKSVTLVELQDIVAAAEATAWELHEILARIWSASE